MPSLRNPLVLAALAAGCSLVPPPSADPTIYVPDTAGLVRAVEVVGPDIEFTLDDGRTLTYPATGHYIGGSRPRADGILLAGKQPAPWVYWAELRAASPNLTPPGCYAVYGDATATPTHVFQEVRDPRGEIVIAFPKAPEWTDEGFETGGDQLVGVGTCLNRHGQAFHFGY